MNKAFFLQIFPHLQFQFNFQQQEEVGSVGAEDMEKMEEEKQQLMVEKGGGGEVERRKLDEEEEKKMGVVDVIWQETKKLWTVAGPAILTRRSHFGITIITQAFVGHVGPTHFAAIALVSTVLVRFANGILAFGSGQYHMLGIYLQRSWIVLFACSIFILPIFLFTAPLLSHLGQPHNIAAMAGFLSRWFIPIILSYVFSFTLQMYPQAQSRNIIISYLAAFSLAIHFFLSWFTFVKLCWGIYGVMASTILANWIPIIGQMMFITCGGCPDTWKGFSWLAFRDMWLVVQLSVSSGAMLW